MNVGLHTTLSDSVSKLDPEVLAMAKRVTPLQASEFGKVWDLFSTRSKPFQTDEYTVLSRNYTAPTVVVTATGAGADWDTNNDVTALPVSAATIDRITIGDVLLVGSEIVVVSAVNRPANTIDVYARGVGDTTAVAHGAGAVTAKVIGNAHREGRVDGEALAEQTATVTNYCQLVEEVIDLSKADSDQARKTGRTEDALKSEAMERVMRDLAQTAIHGTASAGTASAPALSRGLLSYLSDVSGALTTAVGGAFTETVLKNGLDSVRSAGGSVNAIVLSVSNKRIANTFTGADAIQVDRSVRQGGHVLDGYIADGFGSIPFVVDIDMPNDEVALVNTNEMEKGWKTNDQLRYQAETNTNSREKKETLQGKFGLSVSNIGRSHHLLTGIV